MPFSIVRADITKMPCDAIVNAANPTLMGEGGVDGTIHRAAGAELRMECARLGGCKTGEAKLTNGYALPAKYVIHTVGPIYRDGKHGEEALLAACYRSSLFLAKEAGCASVAFPLISSGAYGYPKGEALTVATREIKAFLAENEMDVYLVIFDKASFLLSRQVFDRIAVYIDERYAAQRDECDTMRMLRRRKDENRRRAPFEVAQANHYMYAAVDEMPPTVEEYLADMDAGFSETLLALIDQKGMTDAACYKKANIDRKLFSKIRSDPGYRPTKSTALAFAVALELSLDETQRLLATAGYALSHSSKFDLIVEYFIRRQNYNVFEINEALFAFDQSLLGGVIR